METVFAKVKSAIVSHADAILLENGIKHHRGSVQLSGEWTTGFLCPFCGDKSGSASFTHELHLKCHQCSYKGDVFEWLGKHLGKQPWDVCRQLAERCNVQAVVKAKSARNTSRATPTRMTEEVLEHAIRDLWEKEEAATAREVLAERGLDDQRTLMRLEVGWIKGWVVFSRRDDAGRLEDRYRGWAPKDPKIKWRWFGQGSGGPGIWPNTNCDADRVLLCEGESDALTAIIKLKLEDQGWHVATWTAGATSSPQAGAIPRSWHGKEVHVAYDNDVFQGPEYSKYVVLNKSGKDFNQVRTAAEHRLKNLLQKLCPTLRSLNCNVVVRQCPIDPAVNYGGDLRDWVVAGGRDLDEWKAFQFDELPEFGKALVDAKFDECFAMLNQPLKTRVQVDRIGSDDVVIPRVMRMECELGQHAACSQCLGFRRFPDGIINLGDFQRERTVAIESGYPNDFISRNVVQKPKNCPRLELVTIESGVGSEWHGIRPGHSDETTQRTLRVISDEPPSLSGEVEICGSVFSDSRGKATIMYAHKVTSLDKAEVDLAPIALDLAQITPGATERAEDIDEYLDARWRDLAYNVTRIHGRRDIQIAHDLLAHSVLHFMANGVKCRGWLDISVFGETRSGKSVTFRRNLEHHGLGVSHTAVSNISRAGMVMGADQHGMLRPGLFPKQNGKMLVMDEWHFLCANFKSGSGGQEHPMTWLQAPRDNGITSGVKIYGSRDLKAMVRFCTIANWLRNRRRTFEFACEHLAALYGSPETLARLDFGLPVGPLPTQNGLDSAEHLWTADRTRALILRAWGQDANQVVITEAAEKYAHQKGLDWKDLYDSENIPLFTPEEKWVSLLRIAVSVANLTFSRVPGGDHYSVHVRRVHVEWAASWLEHTWKESGYDVYSQSKLAAHTIERKFEAEKMLTVNLGLDDGQIAANTLSAFLEPFSIQDLCSHTGKEIGDTMKWIARMQGLRVFERLKAGNGSFFVQFCTTKGGDRLISNLIAYAREDPIAWSDRYHRISRWLGPSDPDGLMPMTVESWELFGDNQQQAIPF